METLTASVGSFAVDTSIVRGTKIVPVAGSFAVDTTYAIRSMGNGLTEGPLVLGSLPGVIMGWVLSSGWNLLTEIELPGGAVYALNDAFNNADETTLSSVISILLQEDLVLADAIATIAYLLLAEPSFTFGSSVSEQLTRVAIATELVNALTSVTQSATFNASLSTSTTLTSLLVYLVATPVLTEAINVTAGSTYVIEVIASALESVSLASSITASMELFGSLLEAIEHETSLITVTDETATESLAFLAETAETITRVLRALENVRATTGVAPDLTTTIALLEEAGLAASIQYIAVGVLAESLGLLSVPGLSPTLVMSALDNLAASTSIASALSITASLGDTIDTGNLIRFLLAQAMAESTLLDAEPTAELTRIAAALESIATTSSTGALANLALTLSESPATGDNVRAALTYASSDSVLLSSAVTLGLQRVLRAVESFASIDEAVGNIVLSSTLEELTNVTELIRYILPISLDEALATITASSGTIVRVFAALELLRLVSNITGSLQVSASLMELVAAQTVAEFIHALSAEEATAFVDAFTQTVNATLLSEESVSIHEDIANSFVFISSAEDSVHVADSLTEALIAWLSVSDGIAFVGTLPLGEEDYQAWVINTDSLGITQYTNFPFDGLTSYNGVSYGLTRTGLYTLEGETDAGSEIEASVSTGMLSFGTRMMKSVPRAYLYIDEGQGVYIQVTSERGGKRTEVWYEVEPSTDDDVEMRRVKFSRGVRGTSWKFKITNIDGGQLNLRGAEVLPMTLNKHW